MIVWALNHVKLLLPEDSAQGVISGYALVISTRSYGCFQRDVIFSAQGKLSEVI